MRVSRNLCSTRKSMGIATFLVIGKTTCSWASGSTRNVQPTETAKWARKKERNDKLESIDFTWSTSRLRPGPRLADLVDEDEEEDLVEDEEEAQQEEPQESQAIDVDVETANNGTAEQVEAELLQVRNELVTTKGQLDESKEKLKELVQKLKEQRYRQLGASVAVQTTELANERKDKRKVDEALCLAQESHEERISQRTSQLSTDLSNERKDLANQRNKKRKVERALLSELESHNETKKQLRSVQSLKAEPEWDV